MTLNNGTLSDSKLTLCQLENTLIVDMDVVNDVTCTCQVLLHMWSYDFMTQHYPLNNSEIVW